jgi:hypothetical protein
VGVSQINSDLVQLDFIHRELKKYSVRTEL